MGSLPGQKYQIGGQSRADGQCGLKSGLNLLVGPLSNKKQTKQAKDFNRDFSGRDAQMTKSI